VTNEAPSQKSTVTVPTGPTTKSAFPDEVASLVNAGARTYELETIPYIENTPVAPQVGPIVLAVLNQSTPELEKRLMSIPNALLASHAPSKAVEIQCTQPYAPFVK